jgi:hypothetical protein
VVAYGERCQHMLAADRARKAEHDRNRPTARQRGYSTAWEKARLGFLAKHPYCEHCRQNPATIVHHKIPHRGDRLKFWNRGRGRPRSRRSRRSKAE